ncbi:septum formation initiator family protein [Paracoccus stylophorae]|uniref:Septum formation initiator family protein n=1 Tax=Paracoccus stylophorae TaxID=659350 RepID=A0ABY7SXM6_9RHOB|nr:septum formation initiator family protein [Paracoccus stylophorae]WCR11681.1 septum formation initiator family protein [Paracoccus stylophorae]
MSQRLSISATIFFVLAMALGLYFAFAAVQGPSGILRRIQIEAETQDLIVERDSLRADVDRMQNLTRRMSDEYLDIDLLDERAREVLGYVRSDEIILR